MSVILPIVTKFSDIGIKKAQASFGGLGKSIKGLAGVAGLAIGIGSVVSLLKESTTAAAADIKSQKLLALQLRTTTKATDAQIASTEDFVSKLSMATGVMDDNLRPSLANAVRGTGSLAKGQKLLAIAMDGATASGKPVDAVLNALIKAENGNTTALYKLAPQLRKTKGNLDDYAESVKGAAEAGADPFDRFNVTMDSLKEKLGVILLPLVTKFVDYLQKEVLPKVSKFLDDIQNPDTDIGKAWVDLKTTIDGIVTGFKDFFAQFSENKDATEGLINVMNSILGALPALLALKGIFMLASAGKSIANLAKAIGLMTGASAAGDGADVVAGGGKKKKPGAKGKGLGLAGLGSVLTILSIPSSSAQVDPEELQARADKAAAAKALAKKQPVGSGLVPRGGTLPSLTGPKIPKLALGGIVMPSPGGSIVNVAEAGQPEAIIPLNKMGSLGGSTYNITVNAGAGANGGSIGTEIVNAIKAFERSNGKGWRS
jgi:hypothetical protein